SWKAGDQKLRSKVRGQPTSTHRGDPCRYLFAWACCSSSSDARTVPPAGRLGPLLVTLHG
ncbi:hypothetical protein WDZ92_45140, partial [Nostoc sp. NIES-2111]